MANQQGGKGKRKRTHKVSLGKHGGGGKIRPRLTEAERPAALRGGVLARFAPIGSIDWKRREA